MSPEDLKMIEGICNNKNMITCGWDDRCGLKMGNCVRKENAGTNYFKKAYNSVTGKNKQPSE